VRNELLLYRENEKRNIMPTMKGRRPNGLVETAAETALQNTF
jgi:hypothetical protein